MRKQILILFVSALLFCLAGCNMVHSYYYVVLKNSSGEAVSVRIVEDAETRRVIQYGLQDETYSIKDGETKESKVVTASYFQFYVNGILIHPSNENEKDFGGFYYIPDGVIVILEKQGDSFVFREEAATL